MFRYTKQGNMPFRIGPSEIAAMTPAEQGAVLGKLVEEARNPSYETRAAFDARIRAFELRYEMSSEELKTKLGAGTVKETAEIAEWLFLLDTRESGVSA